MSGNVVEGQPGTHCVPGWPARSHCHILKHNMNNDLDLDKIA